jgi:hypothetical protein
VIRYALAATIRKAMLAMASNGKVRNTSSASPASRNRRITTTPSRVSVLCSSVTTPVLIS